jgi:aspartyl-tRNA(Asn)/glutamyl-tRNA(Gln) amidotransferase subunit A
MKTIDKEITDIATVHQHIQMGELSPVDLVEKCLIRIEQLNPNLNAFITVLGKQAFEQARIAEDEIKSAKYRGPLHGIPIGIKDFYDTAGIKTTAAFEPFKGRVPRKDAASVVRLKEAGAIIIGKTNMHRLGMGTTGLDSYFGPVHNPWNSEYIAGGSSSGSAAAVASGMCYATLDTDAIGSCRLPAACCGVVGFKGTDGLIDPKGILEGEEDPGEMIRWFSHPGIMARTVEDAALMVDALSGGEHKSSHYFGGLAEDRKVRIGVANNFKADSEVLRAFEQTVGIIRRLGFSASSTPAPLYNPRNGLKNIRTDREQVPNRAFKDIDVLLLPTTTTTVLRINEANVNPQALAADNTIFANYYGLPAISIPCGLDQNGLPLGIQIVGKPRGELDVLYLAHRVEQLKLSNNELGRSLGRS